MKPRREAGKVVTGLEESAEKEVGDNYASTGTLLMSEVFEKVIEIKIYGICCSQVHYAIVEIQNISCSIIASVVVHKNCSLF